jgi:hypothetical protein
MTNPLPLRDEGLDARTSLLLMEQTPEGRMYLLPVIGVNRELVLQDQRAANLTYQAGLCSILTKCHTSGDRS